MCAQHGRTLAGASPAVADHSERSEAQLHEGDQVAEHTRATVDGDVPLPTVATGDDSATGWG